MNIQEKYPILGNSTAISNKMDVIINAFTEFYTNIYGEENREAVRSQIKKRFNDTTIVRYVTTKNSMLNSNLAKVNLYNEIFGTSLKGIFSRTKFLEMITRSLNEGNDLELYNDSEWLIEFFGTDDLATIKEEWKKGGFPKIREFLEKQNEIDKYYREILIGKFDAEQKIMKDYYQQLVDEFSYIIPKEELEEFNKIGIPRTSMAFYFGYDLEHDSLSVDEKKEIIRNNIEYSPDEKEKIIKIIDEIDKKRTKLYQAFVDQTMDEDLLSRLNNSKFINNPNILIAKARLNNGSVCSDNYTLGPDGNYKLAPFVVITGNTDDLVIHELNHSCELFVQGIDKNVASIYSGWVNDTTPIGDIYTEDLKYKGVIRENEAISEYVNDRIASDITDILHQQGEFIFLKTKEESVYTKIMDILLADFYNEFKVDIVKSRHDGNIEHIYEIVGKDNFNDLSLLVKKFMHQGDFKFLQDAVESYQRGEECDITIMIRKYVDEKNQILANMRDYSLSKKK